MFKILFVCHGNICRSPMAEFVMKQLVNEQGLGAEFEIASAATSTEELGSPVHRGTRAVLAKHGIGCEGKRARQLREQDYEAYDLLLGMDSYNIRNMRRMLGSDPKEKVKLLLTYAGHDDDIADPWYTGDFDATWRDVCEGCEGLLRALTNRKEESR